MADMSKMAQATYKLGEKNTSKTDRIIAAQDHVRDTGFIVNPKYSNFEITTYQHAKDPKNVVIAHRGTKVDGKKAMRDIRSDLLFAVGMGGHEPTFKDRLIKTNDIINSIQPNQLHLTGHSLGGGTVQYTIANSDKVRSHLTSAKTFNSAAHPIFDNDIKVPYKYKKELETKVEHHRIKNDPVSAGFKAFVPFGKVKTHKIKHDPKKGKSYLRDIVEKNPSLFQKFYNMNPLRFTEKGIYAHEVSHFHSGRIRKKKNKK